MTPTNTTRALTRALGLVLLGAAAAVALGGCHHAIRRAFKAKDCNKPQPYDLAHSIAPLKIPVGIDPPDTHSTLRIPALNEPAPPPRQLTEPCLDEPPAYATKVPPTKPVPAT